MMLCVDNEEKGESVIPLLLVVPNHALYQAKLHPASGDAYHEQSLCASRNFFAGSLDVSNARYAGRLIIHLLLRCPFRRNVAFLDLSGPVGCFCPRAVCLSTKN